MTTDLTPEDRAADFVHATLHSALCGKVPGLPNADLFGYHDEATKAVTDMLLRQDNGPVRTDTPPVITTGTGITGVMLSVGAHSTTLTYEQAVQFAIDLIATTQQGNVRGKRLG